MKKNKLLIVVSCICLVLILAAVPFMSACAKPAPVQPIKIGFLMPLTGPYALWGSWFKNMSSFALDEVNWEVAGRPIEAIIEDEGGEDVSVALEKVKKLVEADKIDLLLGPFYGPSHIALYPYTSSLPLPAIAQYPAVVEVENEYVVWVQPTYVDSQRPLGAYAYDKLGLRTVATLGSDYSCPYEFTQGFTDAFQEKGGKVVQQQWAPLTETDYNPYLVALKEADALVSTCLGPPAMMTLYSQIGELGLHKKLRIFQAEGGAIPEFVMDEIGDIMLGTMQCIGYHYSIDNPANRKYVAAFQAKYERMPDAMDAYYYTFMQTALAALEATGGDTDPDKLYQAMLNVELDTVTGHLSYIPEGVPIVDIYITEVQKVDGKVQTVVIETMKNVPPKLYRGSGYKKFEER